MSLCKVENVVIATKSDEASPSGGVRPWGSNQSYSDGQAVLFNGSLYVAVGSPPVGRVPPVEMATPQQPGSPKWSLAARGRTPAVPWEESATYYQDQVVRYLGGTYILDKPTVPAGTRPNADAAWTPLSETLTEIESQKVSTANLGNFGSGITAQIFQQADESARVRHHRIRVASLNVTTPGPLFEMTFPKPINGLTPPQLSVNAEDPGAWNLGLGLQPLYNASQCIGYRCYAALGFQKAGTYEFSVSVKQPLA